MLIKLILTCAIIVAYGLFYCAKFSPTDRIELFDYIIIPITIISMIAFPILVIVAIWTGVAPLISIL